VQFRAAGGGCGKGKNFGRGGGCKLQGGIFLINYTKGAIRRFGGTRKLRLEVKLRGRTEGLEGERKKKSGGGTEAGGGVTKKY